MIALKKRTTISLIGISLIGSLAGGCSPAKNIVVGEKLSANSEQWVAETKGGGAMRLTRFGPFQMVSYSKIDSPSLASVSPTSFLHLWARETVAKKRRLYSLVIIDEKTTANMLVLIRQTKTENESGILTLDLFKQDGPVSDLKDARGQIRFNGEDAAAYFQLNDYAGESMLSREFLTPVSGMMTYRTDSLRLQDITDYQDGRPGLGHKISKGIIVNHPVLGQVAALQLAGDPHVWMRKDLPAHTRLLIASVFSVLLGSRNM